MMIIICYYLFPHKINRHHSGYYPYFIYMCVLSSRFLILDASLHLPVTGEVEWVAVFIIDGHMGVIYES